MQNRAIVITGIAISVAFVSIIIDVNFRQQPAANQINSLSNSLIAHTGLSSHADAAGIKPETNAEFQKAVDKAVKIDEFFARTARLRILFAQWAKEDPTAAARKLVELDPRYLDYEAVGFVAHALSEKNLPATFAFARDVKDYRVGDFIRRIALGTWSQKSPAQAAQYILAQFPTEQQGRALSVFAKSWGEKEPEAALAFATRINDTAQKNSFLAEAFKGYSLISPLGAVKALADFAPDNINRETLAGIIAQNWSQKNAAAAAAWAVTFPENDPARSGALTQSVIVWSHVDPLKAADFMSQLPRSLSRDEAVVAFVDGASSVDPEIATQWAGSIDSLVLRRGAYQRIAEYYAKQDTDQGQQWLDSLDMLPQSWLEDLTRRLNRGGSSKH